jgi:hypothetical protein
MRGHNGWKIRDVTLMSAHKTMQATTSEGSPEIKHKLLFAPLVYGSFYEKITSAHEGTYLHMSILKTSVHTQ